jgi:hypothetical protein
VNQANRDSRSRRTELDRRQQATVALALTTVLLVLASVPIGRDPLLSFGKRVVRADVLLQPTPAIKQAGSQGTTGIKSAVLVEPSCPHQTCALRVLSPSANLTGPALVECNQSIARAPPRES